MLWTAWVAMLAVGSGWAAELSALNAAIEDADKQDIVAVYVEQHGEPVVVRQLRPGATRDGEGHPELHDIRSAGKSLTALAVGAAIADGALGSVDAPVWPLLGVATPEGLDDVRVRDLLSMSSALDCNDGDRRSPGQEERMYRRRDWTRFVARLPRDPAYARDAQGVGRFSYCTAGVLLLGQVVEKAVGEPFDVYVGRRILAPLGVDAVRWRRSRSGEVQSGGQLEIGAASLARVGRMVLDHGMWAGEPVVPAAWVDEMLTARHQLGPHGGYGYLWWFFEMRVNGESFEVWAMMGNGGNIVALSPKRDAVVVVQSAAYNRSDARENSMRLVGIALASLD